MFCRKKKACADIAEVKLKGIDSKLDDVIKLVTKSDGNKIPKEFSWIISLFFMIFLMWQVFFVHATYKRSLIDELSNCWIIMIIILYALNAVITIWIIPPITNCFIKNKRKIFTCLKSKICDKIAKFKNSEQNKCKKILKYIILLPISPNRLNAIKQKDKIESSDNNIQPSDSDAIDDTGKYYIKRNSYDVSISIILFIITFILVVCCDVSCLKIGNSGWSIVLYMIIYRTISRSFELIIAFGEDCFETKNSGKVQPNNRQILAMSSLVENIFNYAVVYYLVGVPNFPSLWQSFGLSLKTNFFQKMDLNIITTTATTITYPDQASLLMILQFLTSFTLIVFSIAMYASDNKRLQRDNCSGN